jgi:hypothetical protein
MCLPNTSISITASDADDNVCIIASCIYIFCVFVSYCTNNEMILFFMWMGMGDEDGELMYIYFHNALDYGTKTMTKKMTTMMTKPIGTLHIAHRSSINAVAGPSPSLPTPRDSRDHHTHRPCNHPH